MRLLLLSVLTLLLFPSALFAAPASTIGRIVLEVEANGEAWYVDPVSEERFYMRNGDAAYQALRNFGLGITNADLEKIPVGFEDRFEESDMDNDGLGDKLEEGLGTNPNNDDTDGDGYNDRIEVESGFDPVGPSAMTMDYSLVDYLRGRIVLQVEERGQAWYVHPVDGRRYYMSDGEAAYQIMRYLSLGITAQDLATISLRSSRVDCADSRDCFIGMMETEVSATVTATDSFTLFVEISSTATTEHIPNSDGSFTQITTTTERTISYTESQRQDFRNEGMTDEEIDAQEQEFSLDPNQYEVSTCTYQSNDLDVVIENWKFFNDEDATLHTGTDLGTCQVVVLNK